jgi:uncharacterized protein YtpQ (UPF0354 family)
MFRRALSAMGLSAQNALMSEREFASRMLSSIVEAHPDVPIEVTGDLTFTLNPGQDREYKVDLSTHFGLYQMEPERLEALVHLHTANMSEALVLAQVEMTIDLVIPLVRAVSDLKKLSGDPVISEPLTNDLAIVYAFNLPHALRYLTAPALEKLGIDRDDLKTRASANVELLMDQAVVDMHEGVGLVTCQAVSPTSLLFVPEFWRRGPFATIPSIAVMVPERDSVIAFDADNQQAILGAGTVASELMAQSKNPMSKEVMLIKVDLPVEQATPPPAQRGLTRNNGRDGKMY